MSLATVGESDQQAVVTSYTWRSCLPFLLWPAAIVVLCGPFLLAISVALGQGVVFYQTAAVIILVVNGLLIGYAVWVVVELATSRAARGWLALTPAGVHHRSVTFRSFYPWHTLTTPVLDRGGVLVARMMGDSRGSRFERTSSVVWQRERAFAPDLAVRLRWLSVDPATVCQALSYYVVYPEARQELDNETGLTRLHSRRFDDRP